MATARVYDIVLKLQAERHGVFLSEADARTLRRAQLTLRRWAEEECNGTIQRPWDGTVYGDSRPYRTTWHEGIFSRIPDRKAGALRRVAAICERYGLHYYHQGDPRGCSLYIDSQPIPDDNYTSAIACIV
jgi:hypothetical protein